VLSGQKTFITNAPYADMFVVYAKILRDDNAAMEDRPIQAFVLERGDNGLETDKAMRKMGMHSSPTGEIFLQDCHVPADRLLGGREKELIGRASGRDVFHSETHRHGADVRRDHRSVPRDRDRIREATRDVGQAHRRLSTR
jgi:alkylation response protein AidB-like acyl-CoA dehydrogenase